MGDIFPLLINTEKLNKLTENYIVDNTKLKIAIGKVLPVPAVNGIEATIRSYT